MQLYTRVSVVGVILGAVGLVMFATPALAADLRGGQIESIGSQETISDDLYLGGSSVISAATVQGDLAAAGGTVVVTGPVNGDFFAAGGNVSLQGSIGKTLRVAGGNVLIQSTVQNDVIVAGGQIVVTGNGIGRDLVVWGGSVNVNAPVQRNVQITGNMVYLNAPITGNVTVHATKLTLGSGAVISGSLTYTANTQADMQPGARVIGIISYTPMHPQAGYAHVAEALLGLFTLLVLAKFIGIFLLALALSLCLRRFTETFVQDAFARPFTELGRGVAVLILLPVVSILLLFTLVGIPFGILGLLTFVAWLIVSSALAAILLGAFIRRWFGRRDNSINWATIFIGTMASMILSFIPILGWIIMLGFICIALGSSAQLKYRAIKEWR